MNKKSFKIKTLVLIMKRYLFLTTFLILINSCDASLKNKIFGETVKDTTLEPKSHYGKVSFLLTQIISRYHFSKPQIDDNFSLKIFENYLEALDNNRSYFLQSDIDEFEQYKFMFDDLIYATNLQPAYDIFKIYKKRVKERLNFIDSLLSMEQEFDYSIDEYYYPDRRKDSWAKSINELNEIWRKRIKNEALNLKLAGKDWEETKKILKRRYDNFRKAVSEYNSEDVFSIYANAITEAADPHTSYLSPISSDNFKISMSLSLEGIGAQLQQDGDYTKIFEIIPGSPADKSKQLNRNDRIIGVGQGEDGEIVDVIGWRLSDVVKLIRGPKGTKVKLLVIPAEKFATGETKEVILVRDKIKLEEQAAKKKIIESKSVDKKYKIGVIQLPSFYLAFEEKNKEQDYRSATKDVKKLILELKKEKIDGLILDLRNNSGGSLQEAVELTGLFIKDGPVVQVKQTNGSIEDYADQDTAVYYNGPLLVLVSRFSASASEIFAAAIQDYKRGIIVGENTFGKGTVQTLINLNEFLNKNENYGQLKLTIAKFYRISGGSTQHKGVVPDIAYPSPYAPEDFGESANKFALPYDSITPSVYNKYKFSVNIEDLIKKHNERISQNSDFVKYFKEIEEYNQNKKQISLNIQKRKKAINSTEDISELEDEENEKNNEKGKTPKDFMLEEAGSILSDFIFFSSNNSTLNASSGNKSKLKKK